MTLTPDALLGGSVARLREVVAAAEPALTELDTISGDGDFGNNIDDGLARVAEAVARGDGSPWATLRTVFLDEVGGTSGPLFGLLFQSLGLAAAGADTATEALTVGLREGLAAIQRVGEAQVGDRTLVDALAPAVAALDEGLDMAAMLQAAVDGARATAALRARHGRSSYVGDRALGSADPGAVGVALVLSVLAEPTVGRDVADAERTRLLAPPDATRPPAPAVEAGAPPQVQGDPVWIDDDVLLVDGVEFVARTTERFPSEASRFCLVKRRDLVESHLRLLDRLRPRTIVELGIFQGGSVALSALVTDPERLVAVELAPDRIPALDELVAARGLTGRVRTHHGVDQGDAAALRAVLIDAGIGLGEVDLVVDDASHLVGPSRRSFDVLFPYLRPGGAYVIEDWSWAHVGFESHLPDEQPLTQLVFELVLALPSHPGLVSHIEIDRDWAVITRGDQPLDPPDRIDLAGLVGPRGRRMLTDDGTA